MQRPLLLPPLFTVSFGYRIVMHSGKRLRLMQLYIKYLEVG